MRVRVGAAQGMPTTSRKVKGRPAICHGLVSVRDSVRVSVRVRDRVGVRVRVGVGVGWG